MRRRCEPTAGLDSGSYLNDIRSADTALGVDSGQEDEGDLLRCDELSKTGCARCVSATSTNRLLPL